MKNRLGWALSTVAILTFTMGTSVAVQQFAPQAAAAVTFGATDQKKVPHYFGPYPNWANSPQVLSNAVVDISLGTPTPVAFGNPLAGRTYPTDTATTVFGVVAGSVLPAGTLSSFETWNQAASTLAGSAGNVFHAYVLRPTGATNGYTVVYDSGALTVPPLADATVSTVATFPVSPGVPVQAGDFIGWYGQGIPLDIGSGTDVIAYPGPTTAPAQDATITLGVDFRIYPQARTYSIAATVTPTVTDNGTGATATATVDPKTGGISAVTVTSPGSGYVLPPSVSITAGGVPATTPAIATAEISTGVITSITVNETGFGFTTPTVAITGGGTPSATATAQASGGVDNLTIAAGGSGYAIQPLVEFGLPDAPYCAVFTPPAVSPCTQATGTATMAAGGVVNAVAVTDPGSGYTSAPSVTIWDGTLTTPSPDVSATVVATIGVGRIDIVNGGAGYDLVPTVTITETVGGADKGASATATVAVKGAVTGITVSDPGAGYLTPGLKKFVDTLPGLGPTAENNLNQYIPVAVPDTTTYPGTDYYEIGLVQYRHKFSSQIPATLVRGYVQLATDVVTGNVPLTNANLNPGAGFTAASTEWATTPATLPAVGTADPVQAVGVDIPHYLGPTILATKDRPSRITFRNLLPTGVGGDLFLPVDTSLMGSGPGPKMMTLDADGVPEDMAMDEGTVLDAVRNPACGQTLKPTDPDTGKGVCFSENRATLHLHGGITPWISDGTPHQWVTPAGENTEYPKGVSVTNVPDMPDPGPGAETFFYTNQQSARLMFYHDHAWGITRLNVYAGEAAPYLITDDTEKALTADGGALAGLGTGTPLVVQDKTFLPSADKVDQQDPTWDYAKWGAEGSLWAPHVYMPAQNPGDPSGMSSFGRWMYGPWFWPPADAEYPPIANPYYNMDPETGFTTELAMPCDVDVPTTWQYESEPFCEPALIPATPNVSVGMEAFNDTPIVNGTAYPTTTVDPKTYRYRILNAANDRFWNLSWYVADPTTGTLSEVALNQAEVAAAQTDPVVFPTPDEALSPKGPDWVQIGTESGFLPAPVVVPAAPTTWITDPTRFDVGLVDTHSLLLAPAERADVVVDFSQFRGKTLILYNDAPAAFPARVPGYDYYTGGPDLSPSGAPTTLPGYGPNTRTVMQVKVSTAAPELAFDRPNTTADRMGALEAAFAHHIDPATGEPAGVFESGQHPIIVGQDPYDSTYGTDFAANGWCNSPTNPSAKCDGYARIAEQGGTMFGFDTLGPEKDGKGGKLEVKIEPKGIHDEMNSANFDEFGRMSANMGLEAPGATPLLQNIILYPFVNPATEILNSAGMPSSLDVTPISSGADGTQIWKITHNGVDTHPLHFHLYDVQLINRVTWDNIIKPPEATELGWKETVRVSPLEDTIVAIRPVVPTLPFGIPDSVRPLNPMMPIGARGAQDGVNGNEAGFNNTDALGNPMPPIVNEVVNMDWEYVWHCHILSHEEMDMMRPVSVKVPRVLADPAVVTATDTGTGIKLDWIDGTPVDYANPAGWANPGTAEIGYRIERAPVDPTIGEYSEIGRTLANKATFTDSTFVPGTDYAYRVIAFNAAGDSATVPAFVGATRAAPAAPTNLAAALQAGPRVRLTWRDNAPNNATELLFVIERSIDGVNFAPIGTAPRYSAKTGTGNGIAYVDSTVLPGVTYSYRVTAVTVGNQSAYTNLIGVVVPDVPAAPTAFTASAGRQGNNERVTLAWTNNAINQTGFTIQRATNADFTAGLNTANVGANVTTLSQSNLARVQYYYRIRANNTIVGPSAWVIATPFPLPPVR